MTVLEITIIVILRLINRSRAYNNIQTTVLNTCLNNRGWKREYLLITLLCIKAIYKFRNITIQFYKVFLRF